MKQRIVFTEENMTKDFILSKIREFDEEILKDHHELTYLGDCLLGNILWGLPGTLPEGLMNTDDLRSGINNYEWEQGKQATMKKFGLKETDVRKSKLEVVDIKRACEILNGLIDYYNYVIYTQSLQAVTLRSVHPEEYPDKEIMCHVIPNDMIGEYLSKIPEERKFYAHKNGLVSARIGVPGEIITTTLTTIVDGKEYILTEEDNIVKERNVDGVTHPDVVVRNLDSISNEQYVVKHSTFCQTYVPYILGTQIRQCSCGKSARYVPVVETRLLTQVDEDLIIMTAWGAPAVCLAGSYIVTYDAETNDYNTIEKGAFESTYVREEQPTKKLKR